MISTTATGRSSIFRRTRSVYYAWALVITADERESIYEDLSSLTRDPRYHSDPAPPPIVIRLKPIPSGL